MLEYKIKIKRPKRFTITDPWIWKMAWRDARHNFSRLSLFAASLIAGITAVVALDSLNHTLQHDIDQNAKELLGADLVVNGDKKFDSLTTAIFDSTGMPQASEADMASMVYFVHTKESRLIRLVAITGPFPFYGKLETEPLNAYDRMKSGEYAMLDESLASQYSVSTDDSIKVGNSFFKVSGVVKRIPGGGGITATFTPSVYIRKEALDSTGLVQFGSRVNYKQYFKAPEGTDIEQVVDSLNAVIKKGGYSYETVERRKESLGRGFLSIYQFFSLLAFIALILGCIGVASSVHIYAREKQEEVAVLRCVGTTGWQAFSIFFVQIFILGIISSIIGSLLGVGIQQLLPIVLQDLIPFEIHFSISWVSIALGIILGTIVSVLFSMLPLLSVRFIPPLAVLRSGQRDLNWFSKSRLLIVFLIVLFPVCFAALQTRSVATGLLFTAGLIVALLCLLGVATGLLFLIRKFFPVRSGFVLRHSLSSLHRPNNQTRVLMVTIGLGAFIISTLNIVEQSMLSQVEYTGQENQSNTILFDIQPDQKNGVVELMQQSQLKVNQVVPIITCRLTEVKGKSVMVLQQDTTDKIPNWALTREYRVTYRDSLHHSEELIKGDLQSLKHGQRDSIHVTISEGMEENLGVTVGDSLIFDVQGIPMMAHISGIRKVDWPKDPPNFIFVFPKGVLDNAPQIYVTATRIDDQDVANRFQQKLINQFPNVSLIDLRIILNTVDQLFSKLGLVVRFLALFCIISGLIVLAGAVVNSKFIRMRENVLLRTLGARTRQITLITLIEYTWLGLFSALTGMVLSMVGGFVLTTYFFEITFAADLVEQLIITAGVVVLTVAIGWLNSRGIINTPPLQVLRKEV